MTIREKIRAGRSQHKQRNHVWLLEFWVALSIVIGVIQILVALLK